MSERSILTIPATRELHALDLSAFPERRRLPRGPARAGGVAGGLDAVMRTLRDHTLLDEGREPSQEELDRALRRVRSRSPDARVLGVEVAGVGAGGVDHVIVDVSPEAHERRVEAARAIGVITEPYYHLMTWTS